MTFSTNPNLFSLVLIVLILSSSSFLTTASDSKDDEESQYNYSRGTGKGPENWDSINPQWKACGNGKFQSPIDLIDERVQVLPQLGKLQKDYKPAPAILKNRGHDIMLEWTGDAGKLDINGSCYKLVQCHWHTPSEHTLDGSRFDLELHAVHRNSKGETAVIGVWYKLGQPDDLLSKLLDHIRSLGNKDVNVGNVDPEDIRFGSGKYYRYVGSLTVPPCTEGVIWTIVKKVRTVSDEQVKALKEAVHHGFKENSRPTQELGGRPVYFYTPKQEDKEL